mgnify:FL=1
MSKSKTPQMAILEGDGTFQIEVVGESKYFDNLRKIAGSNRDDDVEVVKTAYMVPEPSNQYDPNAIRVVVDQMTVGYLPRPAAAMLSPLLRKAKLAAVQTEAEISAFEGANNYSVQLDGDLNEIVELVQSSKPKWKFW